MVFLFGILFLVVQDVAAATATPDTEMQFSGTLVSEPCTIAPDDTEITLDFAEIIDKYLYINTRTHSLPFIIHLQDCDVTGAETVITHFEGAQSTELPGYLTMGNATIGAAIGIEEKDGSFLGLNKDSKPVQLVDGSTALTFQAFVEGEPTALKNQTITLGEFSSTATFFLEYP
ncbi:fimbrial protein [Buttiauxella sp. B2]|uniref:fimbrial protein n=1 Tax=Buttiauxella sp. B2 TaxID=2587812 RepID=UPI0016737A3C|nr:fimbrial protein [Buttiauxella sp. B2]